MNLMNRGTIEARLKTLRFGLITINAIFIATLLTAGALIWFGVSDVKSEQEGIEYSMGDYMGDIGTWLLIPIIIVIIASLVIYFGYRMTLTRNEA